MVGTMAKIALTNPRLATHFVLASLNVEDIVKDAQEAQQSTAVQPIEYKARELGGGGWRILLIVGAILIMIVLGIRALSLVLSNSSTRNEAKGQILWGILGGVLFFGVAALVILLFNIGKTLFQ